MAGSLISISNVEHWFDAREGSGAPVRVLEQTSLQIASGEFVAIVGPSGCGKTTLLNMVSGFVQPQRGTVQMNGKAAKVGAPNVGYLFARDALVPWRTAGGNVALSMEFRNFSAAERREAVRRNLRDVGLGDFEDAYPAQLSHGMRQRVALARTLAPEPDTLLMDEPFSALDAQTRMVLQEQFVNLWERHTRTVILVTHDLGEAIALADRVVIMSRRPGRIKADFKIGLARPRHISDLHGNPKFHAVYEEIWDIFRDEVLVKENV